MTTKADGLGVYRAIAAVSAELAGDGISKSRKNQQQGFMFRGIDDVYNALAPALAKHGLVILPRVLSREVTERTTQKGGALFYVVVETEFDFVASEDGSMHTVRFYGEAMDTADKATNKAMSAAYKYAAMQTFCIPTEGDNDADSITHEVAAKRIADEDRKHPKDRKGWKKPSVEEVAETVAATEPEGEPVKWANLIRDCTDGAQLLDWLPEVDALDNPYRRSAALRVLAERISEVCTLDQVDEAGRYVKEWPEGTPARTETLTALITAHKRLAAQHG